MEGKARASFRMELQEQKDTEAGRASRHASLNEVGKWPGGYGSGGCQGSVGQEVAMRSWALWVARMSGVQEDIGSSGTQGVVKRPWGQGIQYRRFRRSANFRSQGVAKGLWGQET